MQNRRWINQSHPQTLVIGTMLLYFDAFFLVLSGAPLAVLLGAGSVAAGFGIANDMRIAWYAGVALSAITPILLFLFIIDGGLSELFNFNVMIRAVFPVAQLVALVHPLSRSYVKIWFNS